MRRTLLVLLLTACAAGKGTTTDDGSTGGTSDDTGGSTADVDDDGDGYTIGEGDCDDSDPDIHPGGDEGDEADGIDQDCSGTADDRTVCEDGLADYETIQAGIDDAPEDFVLMVCPGTYTENLLITQRRVTLRSTDGAEVTTVQAADDSPVITMRGLDWVGVDGFTVTGGQASNGGGLVADTVLVSINDNIFTGNSADEFGGGALFSGCTGTVAGNLFTGNTAAIGGGLVAWEGELQVEGNTITNNEGDTSDTTSWSSGAGGGGALVYGQSNFRGNTVSGNHSNYNGGGLYVLYGTGEVTDNLFEDNVCEEDGGGAYFNQSSGVVSGNTFQSNQAMDDAGGMRVFVCGMEITDNEYLFNQANDDAGGMKASHARNTIERNYFEGNQTGDAGGGLELDNETSTVRDCTFINNQSGRGAGLHLWRNEDTLSLEGLVFEGNTASSCGGAMQLDNNHYTVTIHDVRASGNQAVDGSALCVEKHFIDDAQTYWYESKIRLSNSLFVGNTASDDSTIYVAHGTITATNDTIADNQGGEASAITTREEGYFVGTNLIVAGNAAADVVDNSGGGVTLSYSDFYDNDGGYDDVDAPSATSGSIFEDPDFTGDYALSSGSPCVDAGDPSVSDADGSRSDMGWTGGPDAR